MNKVILMGRLTKEPEMRQTSGDNSIAVAHYTLAINRGFRKNGEDSGADYIPCVVFQKGAEFAHKYLHQGSKILISGRLQTGSYVNKDGKKVYTTEVVVSDQEFAESKNREVPTSLPAPKEGDFVEVPEGSTEDDIPFR